MSQSNNTAMAGDLKPPAIAAKIIQEHQGTIRAEKNDPAGAKFIVELKPATNPDTDSTSESSTLEPRTSNLVPSSWITS